MPIIGVTRKGARNARLTHGEMEDNLTILRNLHTAYTTVYPSGGDDSDTINEILTAGRSVRLAGDCTIAKPLIITTANTGIDGNGFRLTMSTASGAFDNTTYEGLDNTSGRYSVSNTGGKKYAVGIRADDLDGVFVRNCRITLSAWVDERYLKAIYFENCTQFDVSGNEMYGFSRGKGVIAVNDCGVQTGNLYVPAGNICRNIIRDCYTNSPYPVDDGRLRQITAIDVDADCLVGTYGLLIDGNTILNMTCSYASTNGVATGQQTDAIQVAGVAADGKPTRGCRVVNNFIYNVGEGIDCYGDDNIIANNTMARCFSYGVKLVNGAARNIVQGNNIFETGLAGIVIGGGSTAASTDDNQILHNVIHSIGPTGDWYNADGTKMWDATAATVDAWEASAQVGVWVNFGGAADAANTVIAGNYIDGNSTADAGIRISGDSGTFSVAGPHILRDNTIVNCAAKYSDIRGRSRRETSRGSYLLGTLSPSSGTTVNLTNIPPHVRALRIEFDTMVFSAAGTLGVAISADDGVAFGSTATIANATSSGSNPVQGTVTIFNMQTTARGAYVQPCTFAGGSMYSTAARIPAPSGDSVAGPYNAIQLSVSGASFSSGQARIYALTAIEE